MIMSYMVFGPIGPIVILAALIAAFIIIRKDELKKMVEQIKEETK